ncbi:MAG: Gfo/Idh/MocA family oxidoreductase [Lewinella sp.]|nr:Gfo/Idh/MocA family oxidoreductase [Lewinella sp.]
MKLRIGVLGTGHLGKIHLKCILLASDDYELVGFYDPDPKAAELVAGEFGLTAFHSAEALMDAVDVVDIVTPTTTHYALAQEAIHRGKHVFIEKPLTRSLEEAQALLALSKSSAQQIQVGHVERFNPALLAMEDTTMNPMFVEAHRLAVFNPRGTDVSVVLDLMIHDLDIVLSLIKSPVSEVRASGVAVVSPTVDIANARLEFENGAVANLTASRISLKQMRKVRLFQRDAYISLDLLEKEAQVVRLFEPGADLPGGGQNLELQTPQGAKTIHLDMPAIEPINAIKMELETFAASIRKGERPRVSIEDGYRALEVAERIMQTIAAQTTANLQ